MSEAGTTPARFHFDPARGDLPTNRRKIADWCVAHTFYADINDMPPAFTKLMKEFTDKGEKAAETKTKLTAILTRSAHVTVDFIWNLAREFGFDPIESEPQVLKDLLLAQIDTETDAAMGENPAIGQEMMDRYRETVRDFVGMNAIKLAAGESLQILTEDLETGQFRTHVRMEPLFEEFIEIFKRTIEA